MKLEDLIPADYNPRKDLQPGDREWEKIERSLGTFGMVEPIVFNKRSGCIVGGHQRLTVEENLGHAEVDVSVVDLDETQEKELNVMLNKAQGAWDDGKLAELMESLGDRATETGFSLPEIEALQSRIEDALDETFLDDELGSIDKTFNVTLDFPVEQMDAIMGYIRENGKETLVELMTEAARKEE
ncbi:MAG: ParB N-terminal domain-containing protein [Clostridia bacterium]